MSRTILLDSGPLGLVTNPGGSKEAAACGRWLLNAAVEGAAVIVPEISDYEVRRELVRARRGRGIARLDALIAEIGYLAITTSAMRQAATFWAEAASRAGRRQPTRRSTETSSWLRMPQPSTGRVSS